MRNFPFPASHLVVDHRALQKLFAILIHPVHRLLPESLSFVADTSQPMSLAYVLEHSATILLSTHDQLQFTQLASREQRWSEAAEERATEKGSVTAVVAAR